METPHDSPEQAPEPTAQNNAQAIERSIERLREMSQTSSPLAYKDFWADSKLVLEQFKSLKPLDPKDRQRLWEQYRDICDGIHLRQIAERQSLREASTVKRADIEVQITEAQSLLIEGAGTDAVAKARELLQIAMQKMKSSAEASPDTAVADPTVSRSPARLVKEDREEIWRHWQKARDLLKQFQGDQHGSILARAHELEASAHHVDPPLVLKQVRELQQQIFQVGLTREQRDSIRTVLNSAWKTAITRLQAIREERKAKHEEWKLRMEENLRRWAEQTRRREQTLEHLRGQIEKLESMVQTARSDDHAERIRGWISETEDKIRLTEEVLAGLREKTTSVEHKLRRRSSDDPDLRPDV